MHVQIPLDPTNYPLWAATAYLPANMAFEYSFIRKESNGSVVISPLRVRAHMQPDTDKTYGLPRIGYIRVGSC
jgi:hypothetical protein